MSRSGFVLTRLPGKKASKVFQDAGFGGGGCELPTLPAEEPDLSECWLAKDRRPSGPSQRGAICFKRKRVPTKRWTGLSAGIQRAGTPPGHEESQEQRARQRCTTGMLWHGSHGGSK